MNFKFCFFFTLAFFVFSNSSLLLADDKYLLKTYTTDNGLSNNFIQSITQDQTGFLWIATWDGLSRFDGSEFKNYYHSPEDSTSIPFFVVDKVIVDQLNNVWVFCLGRPAMILNRSNDCFYRFELPTGSNARLSDIAVGPGRKVWLTSGRSVFSYNVDTKQITCFKLVSDNDNPLISDIYGAQIAFDNQSKIWLSYWYNNEYKIFKGTFLNDSILRVHQFGNISLKQFKSSEIHNTIGNFEFYISESGKIWLFSKYGSFYYDVTKENFVKNEDSIVPKEFKCKPYLAWSEETSGIHTIDKESQSLTILGTKDDNFIETVFADQSGRIWTGDINKAKENIGLNRYEKIPKYFKHYLTRKIKNDKPHLVIPILKDKNNAIWVGDKYLDHLIRIRPEGTEEKINFHPHLARNLSEPRSLALDSDGFWIGTTDDKLIFYDFRTKQASIRFPFHNMKAIESLGIHNILINNGCVIINGRERIYRFNPKTNVLDRGYQHMPKGTGFALVSDNNNGYWLGTYGNTVIHLDSALNKTALFQFGNGTNIIEHICVGDDNDIWVAIMGGGLGHLYPASGEMEIFSTADGLATNVTSSILKDKKGNLWISTNQGISRFNPRTKNFRNYGKEDGLLVTDFNSDSFFQSPDGEIFFGGMGGLISFHPDSIDNNRDKKEIKYLIITDFKVSGITRHFKESIYEMDTLSLEKGDNNFQITFTCLDFQNPEKIKYRYRLVNQEDNWTETNYRNRNVNYANLSPGEYELRIEATDKNEEWNLKTGLLIKIPYKFKETIGFKFLIAIIVIFIFLGFGLLIVQQIKLKEKYKQDELKLESLRGQMNPHFIFNSLNSINYFISNNDKLSANSYIADFSRLIRSFLSNLSSDFIPFEKELESIHDYLNLEHLRFGDKFDYSINTEKITNKDEILIFPGIVQPFIENAIWHGVRGLEDRKGFIQIDFLQKNDNCIQCIIADDGVGRKLSELYKSEMPGKKSRGLGIINERLTIINKMRKTNYSITIEDVFTNDAETGTKVTVDIPIKNIG
ncbi:MAG: histidine kinase [Prolixibacteraceae bacterium]|nr:histidine kinase [Prolixibacteraceae bacterium]